MAWSKSPRPGSPGTTSLEAAGPQAGPRGPECPPPAAWPPAGPTGPCNRRSGGRGCRAARGARWPPCRTRRPCSGRARGPPPAVVAMIVPRSFSWPTVSRTSGRTSSSFNWLVHQLRHSWRPRRTRTCRWRRPPPASGGSRAAGRARGWAGRGRGPASNRSVTRPAASLRTGFNSLPSTS